MTPPRASGLPPARPVPGAFVAEPIPGGNDNTELAHQQETERRERAEQDARRKAAIEAEPLAAARARHAEPVPAVEPVRVGQWRKWGDASVFVLDAFKEVPFLVSDPDGPDSFAVRYANEMDRYYVRHAADVAKSLPATTLEVLQAKYYGRGIHFAVYGTTPIQVIAYFMDDQRQSIANSARQSLDEMIAAIDAAIAERAKDAPAPAPVLTRTDAIRARYANEPRVTWGKKASGEYAPMVDGKYVDNTSWLEACDSHPAAGLSAEAIIARIDAALAKPAPQATPKKYLPWAEAGGPEECTHGYAAGIPCPQCDEEMAQKQPTRLPDEPAPQESTAPEVGTTQNTRLRSQLAAVTAERDAANERARMVLDAKIEIADGLRAERDALAALNAELRADNERWAARVKDVEARLEAVRELVGGTR